MATETASQVLRQPALSRLATGWPSGRCGSRPSIRQTTTGLAQGRRSRRWRAPCPGRPCRPRSELSRCSGASPCAPHGRLPGSRPSTIIPSLQEPESSKVRCRHWPMPSPGSGRTMRAAPAACQPDYLAARALAGFPSATSSVCTHPRGFPERTDRLFGCARTGDRIRRGRSAPALPRLYRGSRGPQPSIKRYTALTALADSGLLRRPRGVRSSC